MALDTVLVDDGATITDNGLLKGHTGASRTDQIQNTGITVGDSDEVEGAIIVPAVVTVTGNTTLTVANVVVLCDASSGSLTITLPAAATKVGLYYIKKIDSSGNTVTIDGNGSETIDDALTVVISIQYESKTLAPDGSNWYII